MFEIKDGNGRGPRKSNGRASQREKAGEQANAERDADPYRGLTMGANVMDVARVEATEEAAAARANDQLLVIFIEEKKGLEDERHTLLEILKLDFLSEDDKRENYQKLQDVSSKIQAKMKEIHEFRLKLSKRQTPATVGAIMTSYSKKPRIEGAPLASLLRMLPVVSGRLRGRLQQTILL